jgi:CRISPR/Cas system-associated endoribonuclease Cas2
VQKDLVWEGLEKHSKRMRREKTDCCRVYVIRSRRETKGENMKSEREERKALASRS